MFWAFFPFSLDWRSRHSVVRRLCSSLGGAWDNLMRNLQLKTVYWKGSLAIIIQIPEKQEIHIVCLLPLPLLYLVCSEFKREVCQRGGRPTSCKSGCEYDALRTCPEGTVFATIFLRQPYCLPLIMSLFLQIHQHTYDICPSFRTWTQSYGWQSEASGGFVRLQEVDPTMRTWFQRMTWARRLVGCKYLEVSYDSSSFDIKPFGGYCTIYSLVFGWLWSRLTRIVVAATRLTSTTTSDSVVSPRSPTLAIQFSDINSDMGVQRRTPRFHNSLW